MNRQERNGWLLDFLRSESGLGDGRIYSPPSVDDLGATAAESLLGSPRSNLPSRMQRLVTPLRRLVLRCIRVYWVQQLAIDRALLAAMRTLRRETRGDSASHVAMIQQHSSAQERIGVETARMRDELTELTAEVHALHERLGEIAQLTPAQTQAKAHADGDPDPRREDGPATEG